MTIFIVRYNDEEKEFEDPHEANMFAMETGLGFPDVIIIEVAGKPRCFHDGIRGV